MTKNWSLKGLWVILFTCLVSCMNMPTPPAQITGSYSSGLKYEEYDCSHLAAELDSLARRENQLVIAQEQRIKTSKVQAFWMGYGQGDGIEASELANVRGEKEAIRHAMESKRCLRRYIPATVEPEEDISYLPEENRKLN